jgi:glycosyltransferase involved in cell wall biosynthesis
VLTSSLGRLQSRCSRTYMPQPLTILSLISSEGYYGAENMLIALAQNLSRLGCRCVVGVFSDSRAPHLEVGKQARRRGLVVEIVACGGRMDWRAVKQIRRLLVKHRVDILNPHGYKADLYAYAAAWPRRAVLVATCHNWPSNLLRMRAYAALDKLMLRRFDKVIAVSDFASNVLRRSGLRRSQVCTISNGVELDAFNGVPPTLRSEIAPKEGPLVGFVGRLVPDKGGAVLLRAAEQVLAVRPDTMFVFVGEGPARPQWEALASQLGIAKQVVFVGVRHDMPGVYASLDMVVLPSFIESMPMCLLEAMAAGKPAIATRVGAVSGMIVSEQTGVLLEPGDVKGLTEAILRLLADNELASRLGRNGRARVARDFSAEAMARNYLRQYEQLTPHHRKRTNKQTELEASLR